MYLIENFYWYLQDWDQRRSFNSEEKEINKAKRYLKTVIKKKWNKIRISYKNCLLHSGNIRDLQKTIQSESHKLYAIETKFLWWWKIHKARWYYKSYLHLLRYQKGLKKLNMNERTTCEWMKNCMWIEEERWLRICACISVLVGLKCECERRCVSNDCLRKN